MRRTAPLVPLAAAGLLLTACGGGGGDGEYALITEGTLTVCSDIPYEPFEFEDADAPSGYTGFDIDLMQAIADNLELELEVLVTSFDAIQSGTAMESDTCDIAASAMTITAERAESLTFSAPYYESLQSLLVAEDSGIASLADITDGSIAVQTETTGQAYAEENAADGAEILEFPTDAEMWAALQAGTVDAILQDLPVNLVHAAEGGYSIAEEYPTDEEYGFAVKLEGKEALIEAVDEQLAALREDGTYDEIYDSYFSAD